MKLKKYLYTLIVLCTMGAFTGCSDWLDYTPKDKETEDQTFSSKQGFYTAVNGVYNRLIDDVMYGKNLTYGMLDLMGKRYNVPDRLQYSVGSSSLNASVIAGYSYSDIDFSPIIESIWEEAYSTILNINVILDNAEQKRGTVLNEDDYNLIKGDLLALRAFLHFELLRLFAPAYSIGANEEAIPYVTRLTHLVTPMSTQEEAIDLILTDLDSAKVLLANDPIRIGTSPDPCLASLPSGNYLSSDGIDSWYNRRFRFNYYAAVATMARVYLWKGDNANALTAAQEVIAAQESRFPWVDPDNLTYIGNTSSTSYRNQDRTFATEHIFALNVVNLEDLMDSYIYDGEIGMGNMNQNGLEISAAEWTDVYEGYTADYRYQKWYASYASNMGNDRLLAKFYQNDVTADEYR